MSSIFGSPPEVTSRINEHQQQLLDVAQAQVEPIVPAYRAADDPRRKAVAMIERFRPFHFAILPGRLSNVTESIGAIRDPWRDYILLAAITGSGQPAPGNDKAGSPKVCQKPAKGV
jgi:hypothetical protein